MIDRARRTWPRASRPMATIALCALVATGLQGCIEMMVGTAVVGTLAASDRRTFGAQTEDKTIVIKGENRIARLVGDSGHINVNSFNRKVLLTGEVRDEAMKAAVEREAAAIEGVNSVVNEVAVAGISSFGSRSNDVLLQGKIKASFVDARDLYANSVKVIVERGVVYLMGRVTEREAHLATEITRGVSGVEKVVRVFELIDDNELKELSKTTLTPASK